MGYTLKIGNAVIRQHDKYDHEVRLDVERAESAEAPRIPNDEGCNQQSNERWPSYTAWADFARATDTYELFLNKEEGLLHPHPGVVYLTQEHAQRLTDALARYRGKNPKALPGLTLEPHPFNSPESIAKQEVPPDGFHFDYVLARLVWCEWWVRWALANCAVPAFYNS